MSRESSDWSLPVAVIGSGPIGLAAAAHLHARGRAFVVLEAGNSVASSILEWAHVKLFTPWRYNIDEEAARLLEAEEWESADPDGYPTGAEFVRQYLEPLAALPSIRPHLFLDHRVTRITRLNRGKLEHNRSDVPFELTFKTSNGGAGTFLASAVIDASGSWTNPNPIGSNGLPVPGEDHFADRIAYGLPDILEAKRHRYAGKRVLVIGSGHSAMNALERLVELASESPQSEVHWAIRSTVDSVSASACDDDGLTERNLLKRDIRSLIQGGAIQVHDGVRIDRLERYGDSMIALAGNRELLPVDELIVAIGFRPDHAIARELRLDLHHTFESPHLLAELIDPSVNACGTVPPHNVARLAHPEEEFYVAGMKSYGRAPTFLMLAGYEQIRSIVCALMRDDSAFEIHLDLPERGLCSACTAYLDEQDRSLSCSCGTNGAGEGEECGAGEDIHFDSAADG